MDTRGGGQSDGMNWEAGMDMHALCAVPVPRSCPSLRDPMNYRLRGSSVHGTSPSKEDWSGCHALLQAYIHYYV